MIELTICTPSYNRRDLLPRVYDSLRSQTKFDFEWLIIDDGSSDHTGELCEKWIRGKQKFPIRYFYQTNSGKCAAINKALNLARGEWFLVLDSDDFLSDDAVEKINRWTNSLPDDEKYCAVAGRATYGGSEPDVPFLAGEYLDCTFFDRYPRKENHYFFIGHDRPWVFRTEVHKKYPYPLFTGEKFMTEAVAWNRMAKDKFKIRCFNDIIYTFDHQNQGLTSGSARNFIKNPQGYGLWLSEMARFLKYTGLERLKQIYVFTYDLNEYYSVKEIARFIDSPTGIISMCKIIGRIKRKYDEILKNNYEFK